MEKLYLSKSKYCKAVQCNKIIWLDKYMPEEAEDLGNESILTNGSKVGILAKGIFGKYIDIQYDENVSKMIDSTKKALGGAPNIITEASFEYDGNFCSVDILKNFKDYVEIYEVKSSTDVKDIFLDDISYQVYVLRNIGLNVKKAFIIYLNSEYERHGDLELNKLFNIEDVTKIALDKQDEIKNKILDIREYMKKYNDKLVEPSDDIDEKCFKPYGCPYW